LSKKNPRIILVYHGVSSKHKACIDSALFKEQMLYLLESYKIFPVDKIVTSKEGQDSPCISITFDDAYVNLIDNALPLLNTHKVPATIYAPTNYLGKMNEWDASTSIDLLPIMDKKDLQDITFQGFHVGSHTKNHKRLKGMNHNELFSEVADSKKILEDIVGHQVTSFAYPHGGRNDLDERAIHAVRDAGYSTGVTTFFGRHNSLGNRFNLRRIIVWPSDSMEIFKKKLTGYYDWLVPKEVVVNFVRSAFRKSMTQ